LPCDFYRLPDVAQLGILLAAGKQDDNRPMLPHEIHTISGSIVYAHFRYAFSHGFDVPEMPKRQLVQALLDMRPANGVPKTAKPF